MNAETPVDAVDWLRNRVDWRRGNSADSWYEYMASQSGERLPVVYEPFDGRRRGHFADRGAILDFAAATGGGRVLDLGPGDGWPSLPMASLVDEVVGVDASPRRVRVCKENAARLGVRNARFVCVPPGEPLPFADASFDGVTAASSLEQTPDPLFVLQEMRRVLRPGGRLRMSYESLGYYAGREERALALADPDGRSSCLLIMDRHPAAECADYYGLVCDLPGADLRALLSPEGGEPTPDDLTMARLEQLVEHVVSAAAWRTRHPSCCTWLRWLDEAGFAGAVPTHSGGEFAGRLHERLGQAGVPSELAAVDRYLRPLVEVVVQMETPAVSMPGRWGPHITAVR